MSPTPSQSTDADSMCPLSVPHLIWKASALGRDEFPVPVECMFDSGAHLVLIRPETVIDLGLQPKRLRKSVPISVALENSSAVTLLNDYVSLSLSSLNNAWTSRPLRAIIAPGLCTNILLGLPFLTHNSIVIDHTDRTAIDKISGFDLLNEQRYIPPPAPRERLSPKSKRDLILKYRRLVMNELKFKLAERTSRMSDSELSDEIKPLNCIAAITSTIQLLASKERLGVLEKELKEEFRAIFEPIPHASLLPTTTQMRIQVDEAYKTLSARSYPCPRKYKEAFARLIQQRLDQGFIRPSASAFVSPSFIIPKADPAALPRWVCDYRKLNKMAVPDHFPLPRIDDLLADCAKGKIWAKFDMTDSFFQVPVHPDDIHKTMLGDIGQNSARAQSVARAN